jgi:peroxiredoxin
VADQSKFDALDIQLIAIGSSNPFAQKTFVDSLKATYPFLSDYPDLKVIKQFGILQYVGEEKRPMAKGSVFLIDKQGIIRGKWIGQGGGVMPSDQFLGVVKELEGKS